MRFLFLFIAALMCFTSAQATVSTANVLNLNTATTNVTTSAYVTLTSAIPIVASEIVVVNATSSVIKIAYGASGSETDFVAVNASSQLMLEIVRHFPVGTRIAVEAVSATASTGYISLSLIP